MNRTCPSCGGELKSQGIGFRCICCSASFSSAEELRPMRKPTGPGGARGDDVLITPKSDRGVDVFSANINSVLEITWSDGKYVHSGSGFLFTQDGYAITNTHVVTHENGKSCRQVNVHLCGEDTTADVVKLGDDRHGDGTGVDLALIKLARIPAKATVVQFEDFDNVRIGERVFVIGNSLGHGTCITAGIVSDRLRNVNGKMLMMTDCAINGGNSGGPIFNENGRVIAAVVSGISSAEGMNFAIPSTTILRFLQNVADVCLMQFIPDKPNPYEEPPTQYAGAYQGPQTPPISRNPPQPGGRFWGIGVQPPKETTSGGRFEGLRKTEKALAPCPRCDSDNTDVENGIFVCNDCDFEGA